MKQVIFGLLMSLAAFMKPEAIMAESNFNNGTFFVQSNTHVDALPSLHPQYVVNQPFWYELSPSDIQSIHQRDPNTKILRYRSGVEIFNSSMSPTDIPAGGKTWWIDAMKRYNSASDWTDIWNTHKNWFLKDRSGTYIVRSSPVDQPGNDTLPSQSYLMDPGNVGYQEWLFTWIKDRLTAGKFDGVYLDLMFPAVPGRNFLGKPNGMSEATWNQKLSSLVRYIQNKKAQTPEIANKLIIINGVGYGGEGFLSNNGLQYITNTQANGAQFEMFLSDLFLTGGLDEAAWKRAVDLLFSLSALHGNTMRGWVNAKFNVNTNGGGTVEFHKKNSVFVLASYLLGNNSPNFAFGYFGSVLGAGGWVAATEMNFRFTIGSPNGVMEKLPNGLYHRVFAHGVVYVNPTRTTKSFTVANSATDPITNREYTQGETVGMGPQTGKILLRSPSSNPADVTDEGDTPGDQVSQHDADWLKADFGKTGANGWISSDINDDGRVDIFDYNALVAAFGS